jgi:hypothetical protein
MLPRHRYWLRWLLLVALICALMWLYRGIYWELVNWHSETMRADFYELLPIRLFWLSMSILPALALLARPCRLFGLWLAVWTVYPCYELALSIPEMLRHWGPHGYLDWNISFWAWAYGISITLASAILAHNALKRRRVERQMIQEIVEVFDD